MTFEGFTDTEMPTDDYIFLEVKGLSVNGQLDARQHDTNPGYVVSFKRKGAPEIDFFRPWYHNEVILQYFCVIREKLGHTSHVSIPPEERLRLWSDSDMANIAYLANPVLEMSKNMSNGMDSAKIGAKSTAAAHVRLRRENDEAEEKIKKIVPEVILAPTYEVLSKLVVKELKAFIIARTAKNPLEALKGPKRKGTAAEANDGIPCLLTLAKDFLGKPFIVKVPTFFDSPALPQALAIPDTIRAHNGGLRIEIHFFFPIFSN
jgi:hypothetical protein